MKYVDYGSVLKVHLEFYIKNTLEAIKAWKLLPEDSIAKDLDVFRATKATKRKPSCKSPACFGGWLPFIPYFKELGVYVGFNGCPNLADISGTEQYLFGSNHLFQFVVYLEMKMKVPIIVSSQKDLKPILVT